MYNFTSFRSPSLIVDVVLLWQAGGQSKEQADQFFNKILSYRFSGNARIFG